MTAVDARPTLTQIREWPATVDVAATCAALGISRSYGYQLIARGAFPCRVIVAGRRARVVTASLITLLEEGAPG